MGKNVVSIIDILSGFTANVNSDKELEVSETNSADIKTAVEAIKINTDKFVFTGDDLKVVDSGGGGGVDPVVLSHKVFNITTSTITEVITGVASETIKIYGISIHNNEATEENDSIIQLGNGTTKIYGDSNLGIYLAGRGGVWGLPVSQSPYWILTTGVAGDFNVLTNDAHDISGVVFYTQE